MATENLYSIELVLKFFIHTVRLST